MGNKRVQRNLGCWIIIGLVCLIPVCVWAWGVLGLSGGVPANGATNYTEHANIVSWWYLEEDVNDDRLDGSDVNNNDLSDNGSIVRSVDQKQGTYSIDFERDGPDWLAITDVAQSGLDITGSITIVMWIKPETWEGSSINYVVSKYADADEMYDFFNNWGTRTWRIGDGTNVDTLNFSASLTAGSWYHIGLVFDAAGQNMYTYVNGSEDSSDLSTTCSSIADNSAAFQLSGIFGNSNCFDGLMDEVAIFNTNLSEAQIDEIYTYGLDGQG